MRRLILVAAAIALLVAPLSLAGPQKVKAYAGQAGYTFVNTESVAAHGLHVTLSAKGVVVTDPESGVAGPFRNVQGNDSNHLVLGNPADPVAGNGEGKFDLMFRSYDKKLKITGWWWTDERGKRIGEKHKL